MGENVNALDTCIELLWLIWFVFNSLFLIELFWSGVSDSDFLSSRDFLFVRGKLFICGIKFEIVGDVSMISIFNFFGLSLCRSVLLVSICEFDESWDSFELDELSKIGDDDDAADEVDKEELVNPLVLVLTVKKFDESSFGFGFSTVLVSCIGGWIGLITFFSRVLSKNAQKINFEILN